MTLRRKADTELASDDEYAGEEENNKGARKAKRSRKSGDRKAARSTSRFRGVTHHCRTGRFEAHIWQEGKQIYLGGFDAEEQAALAYDLAALKFRGIDAQTNYDKSTYEQEMLQFNEVTKEEVVQTLRRQSKGFQKTSSQYRGVTRHQKGKWEARIGQMVGKKYKYLGLFTTELEAAQAYDRESVARKGVNAITNFDLSHYTKFLSTDDLEEAKRRGILAPAEQEDSTGEATAELGAWSELPDQALPDKPSFQSFLQGASDPMQVGQQGLMTIENWADPPLRGYSSMPTMHTVPEDHQLNGLALAVEQGKYMILDGITPKSVFGWQTPAGAASPCTPQHDPLPQLPQGLSLQHLEADILSSGGVLTPHAASGSEPTDIPPAVTERSQAIGSEHFLYLEQQEYQSHLGFLLNDEWLQSLHTECKPSH